MNPRAIAPEEIEELSAYLDGELDPAAAEAMRERLDGDPSLAEALRALEGVDTALRAIRAPEITPALAERVRARIADERGKAPVLPLRRRGGGVTSRPVRLRPALLTAAALAAAVALALLIRGQIRSGPEPTFAPLPDPAVPHEQRLEERAIPSGQERELLAPTLPEAPTPTPSPAPPEVVVPRRKPPPPAPGRIAERAPDAIEAATDEELALALELEVLGAGAVQAEDLAIIEQLDFVEMLRDLEGSGQRG